MNDRRTAGVGDVRLAYQVYGASAAPPVVLLHALGEVGSTWQETATGLAVSHHVYAVDLRGHGASDRAAAYSFELMRDDVVALLDVLGLDRVTLVGHSMGATVAYLLAGRHPERVDRLVLEEPPPPVPADPPRHLPEHPEETEAFDWAAVDAIYRQRNDPDPAYWDVVAAITAPTLVVAGGPGSPLPQDQMARLAETIPDHRLVTIDAGHLVHEERPEEFAAALAAFLS
ncbi:alpha/beta hydrolase [Actinoallomurus sp. NPDC050550]|uniref:alpha/beta fold hydrolase n=1 Tax=Actinoallomurus sp. NPDC050550 TaxID=3154937 RepID=UPI0033DBE800